MAKKLLGQAAISVTATPQRADVPDMGIEYTLQNTGTSNAVYYKFEPSTATSAFAGTDTVLRGLGAGKLEPGEAFIIGPGIPWLDVVCATGLTSTLEIEPGKSVSTVNVETNIGNVGLLDTSETEIDPATEDKQDDVIAEVKSLAGGSLTFQPPIAIAQGAAGRTTVLALEASKVIRLHALVLTADAAGTVKVCYDDDGAGTNEVDLTGALPVGANGGFVIPFNAHPDGCLKTAAGKQLTIFSATSKMSGYAICSKHTS